VAVGLALAAFFWVPALAGRGTVHAELGAGGNLTPLRWLFDPLRPEPDLIEPWLDESYRVSRGTPFDLHWFYPHASSGVLGPAKPGLAQVVFCVLTVFAGLIGWLDVRRRTGQAAEGSGLALQPVPGRGEAPRSAGRPRFSRATLAVCLVTPLVLWFLTTTWAEPVWRSLPLLWVLQFPWRLHGAQALTLALAGAGVFAWLARIGQPQWVLALLLTVFVAVNGRAGQGLETRFAEAPHVFSVPSRLRGSEGAVPGAGTASGGEFLPLSVVLPDPLPPDWSWRDAFESRYPEWGWIAGRVWPLDGRAGVEQVWSEPSWTAAQVDVAGDAPAELGFRTLAFPGWRAYVDGKQVSLRPAPFDPQAEIGHGFAVVTVPPGRHLVQLAARPTPATAAGAAISLAGLMACAGILGWPLARVRWRGAPARAWRVALAAGTATVLFTSVAVGGAMWSAGQAPEPPAAGGVIVLDVLAKVRQEQGGGAASPPGDPPRAGVDAAGSGAHPRPRLAMPPLSEAHADLDVPPRAVFQAGLGLDRQEAPAGAGLVRYILEAADAQGRRHTLLDEALRLEDGPVEQSWRFVAADLGGFAGQRITLTLRTESPDASAPVSASWAAPLVYVDRSARYPPGPAVAGAPERDPAGVPP
jgi:hypothetical protein